MKDTIKKLIDTVILPKYDNFKEGPIEYKIHGNISGFGNDRGYLIRYTLPVSNLSEKGIKQDIADDTILLLRMIGFINVKNHRNSMTYNDTRLIDIIGGDKIKK